jgi:hypothetical protein
MSQPSICLSQQVHRPSPWRTQRSQSMSRHVKTGIILSKYLCQIILQLPSALKDPERLLEGSLASSHLCAILPMYIMCPCVRVNTLNCIDMRTQTYNTTPRQTIPYPTLPYLTRLTSLTLPYLPIHTHNITLHCIALHHITSHHIRLQHIIFHVIWCAWMYAPHICIYVSIYVRKCVCIYILYTRVCVWGTYRPAVITSNQLQWVALCSGDLIANESNSTWLSAAEASCSDSLNSLGPEESPQVLWSLQFAKFLISVSASNGALF